MEEGAIVTPQKEEAAVVETPSAPMKKRELIDKEEKLGTKKPDLGDKEPSTPPTIPMDDDDCEGEGAFLSEKHADERLPPFNGRLAEEGMRFDEETKRAAELSPNAAVLLSGADIYMCSIAMTSFTKESLECLYPSVHGEAGDLTKTLKAKEAFETAFNECCEKEFFQVSKESPDQYALVADAKTIISIRQNLDDNVRKRLVELGCEILKSSNQ